MPTTCHRQTAWLMCGTCARGPAPSINVHERLLVVTCSDMGRVACVRLPIMAHDDDHDAPDANHEIFTSLCSLTSAAPVDFSLTLKRPVLTAILYLWPVHVVFWGIGGLRLVLVTNV